MPQDIGGLRQYMVEEWENISDRTVKNSIRSMKNRCKLVIKNNGDRISY